MRLSWHIKTLSTGIRISCIKSGLSGRKTIVPASDWNVIKEKIPGASLLDYLLEAKKIKLDGDAALMLHSVVAELEEPQATLIGLPPSIPHALEIKSSGTIDEKDFSLKIRWLRYGTSLIQLKVIGSIAIEGDHQYRIPGDLFQLIQSVDAFEKADTSTREDRITHWQPIQKILERLTSGSKNVRPDGYIKDLRIFHAASLSFSAEFSQDKDITFDPILFGRTILRQQSEDLFASDPLADPASEEELLDDGSALQGVDTLVDEADALLPAVLQDVFVRKRFNPDQQCRESYPLKRNTFVYLDPPLRQALNVVKKMQHSSAIEKRAFVKNPRSAFAQALGEEADSIALRGLFVETQQFADWINGVGIWKPKVLPWLPLSPTSWIPEKIGFEVDDKKIEFPPDRLEEIRSACHEAIEKGNWVFTFEELEDLPATSETLAAIDTLIDAAKQIAEADAQNEQQEDPSNNESSKLELTEETERFVLEGDENLEELLLKLDLNPREANISSSPPEEMMTSNLLDHQIEGFNWLVKTWRIGRPGVLLADDMGLGKTIQTLAFAAWLQAKDNSATGGKRGPFLIVAPTALLKNWAQEHDKHLSGGGIGPIAEVYGNGISQFKTDIKAKRDIVEGHGVLDREKLRQVSCILTTYETLANYHMSFAGIRYPLVVFDEIQKLKTPTTINTHAAKTLNIDFVVGLTGTPVENNLSELWSIMDRLHPGLLQDLRSFTRTYHADDHSTLESLRDELRSGEQSGAAIMLRRMKDTTDIGQALPERFFESLIREMPIDQAEAYKKVVLNAQIQRTSDLARGSMLQTIQRLRGISLHPANPKNVLGRAETYDHYVGQSARLRATVEVLDKVRERGEKALVFIDYRDMQRIFADILRHRYELQSLPSIINGQTPSARRQDLVAKFQQGREGVFDLMILSPRAAGVGLNITAANHVVHLSRWWNPAVEDQCNDRAYRIGQEKPVTVHLPIARHPFYGDGSFDIKLNDLLDRKRKLSRDLLVPAVLDSDLESMFDDAVPI